MQHHAWFHEVKPHPGAADSPPQVKRPTMSLDPQDRGSSESYDEKLLPVLARKPLEQAENNYAEVLLL